MTGGSGPRRWIGARLVHTSPLARRALLHAELELARWLLHGIDTRDDAVIDDAVGLLDGLVASVHEQSSEPLTSDTGPILAVAEVERLLDETPRDVVARDAGSTMLTDSYDVEELRRHLEADRADGADGPAQHAPRPGEAARDCARARHSCGTVARGALLTQL